MNPWAFGGIQGQQPGGFLPNPYAVSQTTGFSQFNPLAAQFSAGIPQGINAFVGQLGTNVPVSGLSNQWAAGGRLGSYGVDPRLAFGTAGQQFGYSDPTILPNTINQAGIGDPISSLFQHQVNPLAQQQLPIRPLIGSQQGLGIQSLVPGINPFVNQWVDPYRAFVEAQLISQLATNNPLYQLQRAYGGVPEVMNPGIHFAAGQQFNPLFANVPFQG